MLAAIGVDSGLSMSSTIVRWLVLCPPAFRAGPKQSRFLNILERKPYE